MRTPMHETVRAMRPDAAVNETLCQPSPLAHRLVSTKSKIAPSFVFSVAFEDEPKSISVFLFSISSDIVEKVCSPVATITPELCLHYSGLMEHWGQHHCLPASWFLDIFCTGLCSGTFDIKCQPAEKRHLKYANIDFNICLLNCLLTVELLEKKERRIHSEVICWEEFPIFRS